MHLVKRLPSGAVSTSPDVAAVVLWSSLALGMVLLAILLLLEFRKRQRVSGSSAALRELKSLNLQYGSLVRSLPRLNLHFTNSARSKSAFDRLDLETFMRRNVLEQEANVQAEVDVRVAGQTNYASYVLEYDRLRKSQLGASGLDGMSGEEFARRESDMFHRRKLKPPKATARVRASVTYRSPKGQNSYSRGIEWDWQRLQFGLAEARAERERQSTSQYLRQRERAMMTDRLRMQILRRDNFRCRMCGAAGPDGVELHVDHITPVSRGGKTLPENLQALCKPCNLGKSNTFVG